MHFLVFFGPLIHTDQKTSTINKVGYLGLREKKLDGVGPVDNRPSTKYLHYFVKKNIM